MIIPANIEKACMRSIDFSISGNIMVIECHYLCEIEKAI